MRRGGILAKPSTRGPSASTGIRQLLSDISKVFQAEALSIAPLGVTNLMTRGSKCIPSKTPRPRIVYYMA